MPSACATAVLACAATFSLTVPASSAEAGTVCAKGCDFSSISEGIANSPPGSVLLLQTAEALTEANIVVTQSITIEGQDIAGTVLQAAEQPESGVGRVFTVPSGVALTLKNMTVRHGDAALGGAIYVESDAQLTLESVFVAHNRSESGAVYNRGNVILRFSDISFNHATDRGAGVFNRGTVVINSAWVRNNWAQYSGGGIFNADAGVIEGFALDLRNNRSGDLGGGIFNRGALSMQFPPPEIDSTSSSVVNNRSRLGGGIYNDFFGSVSLTGYLIANNVAYSYDLPVCGGAIFSRSTVHLSFVELYGNRSESPERVSDGGGLCIERGRTTFYRSVAKQNEAMRGGAMFVSGGIVEVNYSTLSTNAAEQGGGIHQRGGKVWATYSTLIMNEATLAGGGLYYCGGQTSLANTTVAQNRAGEGNSQMQGEREGGGFWPCGSDLSRVSIASTIIAGNVVGGGGSYPDCSGEFGFANHSLIENPGASSAPDRCRAPATSQGMVFDASPQFTAYVKPGYLEVASTSPAVDAGVCQSALGLPTSRDQILQFAPTDGDDDGFAECDMGAFETRSTIAPRFLFLDGFEQAAGKISTKAPLPDRP